MECVAFSSGNLSPDECSERCESDNIYFVDELPDLSTGILHPFPVASKADRLGGLEVRASASLLREATPSSMAASRFKYNT